jgi:purine-binding chemotaxis protein CheW
MNDTTENKRAPVQLLAFVIDDQFYALRIATILRVVRMAALTTVPKASPIILGLLNWQGEVIPVVDARRRFGLKAKEPESDDQLIIARTRTGPVCLPVDAVSGVIERSADEIKAPEEIARGLEYVDGVTKLDDQILFIYDLDRFLSTDEHAALEEVLAEIG